MRNLFLSAAAGGLLLAAGCVAQTPDTAAPTATTTLQVNANLVVVPVTVRDNKDRFIRTLNKEDFTLSADGKPQTIRYFDREDDIPLTLGLLVDVSGSQRSVLDNERDASSAFLDGMLQPGRDQAFVVQFGHAADLLADITQSVPKLQAGLQKIDGDSDRPNFSNGGGGNGNGGSNDPNDTSGSNNNGGNGSGRHGGNRSGGQGGGYGGSGTVLYDAVFLSSDEVLKKAPAAKGTNASQARKALIVLSDGVDRGSKESLPSAIEAAQRNNTALYAIYYKGEESHDNGGGGRGGFPGGGGGGFPGRFPGGGGGGYPGGGGHGGGGRGGGGNQPKVDGKKILERMADETGGRVYEVTKKMTLTEIYRQIAEELRSQYRIGFSPSNNEAGYHKLVIDVPKDKKAILQARDGYYTGDSQK